MTAVPRERLRSCYWKRSAADRIDRINIENDHGRPRRVARSEHRAGATACDRSLGSGGEPSDVNVVGIGERRGGGLALALMGAGTTFWQCQARARNREQSRRPAAGSDRVRRRSCAGAGQRVCRARRSSPLDLRRSPRRPAPMRSVGRQSNQTSLWRVMLATSGLKPGWKGPIGCPAGVMREYLASGSGRTFV